MSSSAGIHGADSPRGSKCTPADFAEVNAKSFKLPKIHVSESGVTSIHSCTLDCATDCLSLSEKLYWVLYRQTNNCFVIEFHLYALFVVIIKNIDVTIPCMSHVMYSWFVNRCNL